MKRVMSFAVGDEAMGAFQDILERSNMTKSGVLREIISRRPEVEEPWGLRGDHYIHTSVEEEDARWLKRYCGEMRYMQGDYMGKVLISMRGRGFKKKEPPAPRPEKKMVSVTLDQPARAILWNLKRGRGKDYSHWVNEALRAVLTQERNDLGAWEGGRARDTKARSLSVEKGLWEDVEEYAEMMDMTKSEVVRMALWGEYGQ